MRCEMNSMVSFFARSSGTTCLRGFAALLTGFLVWSAAVGQDLSLEELEVDHALTTEFATPHTDWATPYALGKTRVLFFTEGKNTRPRECVELLERFDLDAQAVFWAKIVDSTQTHWHGGQAGERRMLALLKERWDCFVFMGVAMAAMPPEQQYRMLKAVTEGAGLVLVGCDDRRVLKDRNRFEPAPGLLTRPGDGEPAVAYRVGGGRAVRMPARPEIPYGEGWQVEDDYWQERLGRAVLWAAGREPKVGVELRLRKAEAGYACAQPEKMAVVHLSDTPAGQQANIHLRVRRPADEPIWLGPAAAADDRAVAIGLPDWLPAGDYRVDAWLRSSLGVEGWASVPLAVTSSRSAAAVELERDWGEVGETIAGRVRLEGNPLEGEQIRVRLLDRRRRELARLDAGAERPAFRFAVEPWMPMLVTVEAQVLQAGREASRASAYFRVTRRNRGQFNLLMWDVPSGTLAPYAQEALARTGMTLQLKTEPCPPLHVAAFDVAYVPYTTRITVAKTAEGVMRPFCWNDAQAVAAQTARLAEKYAPSRRHGAFVYSLGDENHTRGCCLSPHCDEAYRHYLREVYGSLERLNDSWGTTFKDWQEVGLAQAGDVEEDASRAAKNYPRWFDRQAFKSANYVNLCRRHAEAFRRIDPQSKTGFEGAGRFAAGDNLEQFVRELEFWAPYPGTADEVLRSIAPRDFPRANWIGYTKDADSLLGKYWRIVTRGCDAVWWWRWDCIGRFHGWLAPDLRPYPAVKDIMADTRILHDGLGDLLLASAMQDDGVAIVYSYPSVFAAKLAEGASFGDFEGAHLRAQQILRDAGLQFRYVTDRLLEQGFGENPPAVLVLPRTEALSDGQAEVIRKYVERGGIVVADVRPALYNEHCKPRAHGALDGLFGIARRGAEQARPATVKTTVVSPMSLEVPKLLVDPAVKVGGDLALVVGTADEVPAAIVHPVGAGHAVLLNYSLSSWPRPGTADDPRDYGDVVRSLGDTTGVWPRLTITDAAGKAARNVEVIRWANGRSQIVALLRERGEPEQLRVRFTEGASRWVDDLRERKSLGPVKEFTTVLRANRANFFLVADGKAAGVKLDAPAEAARGTVVKARLSAARADGLQALRLRVSVGARRLEWFDRRVLVDEKGTEVTLPVAYNDPAGDYRLEAVDLLDRVVVEGRLAVK